VTAFRVIRFAKPRDAHRIVELNNQETSEYAAETGFIISRIYDRDVEKALASPGHGYIVAEIHRGRVGAFVRIVDTAPADVLSELTWTDLSSRNLFYSSSPKYAERIVVGKNCRRSGIGRDLYAFSETYVAHTGLYMFVCVSPVENIASIRFHETVGFKKAAIFRRDIFNELVNYESVLMLKVSSIDCQ
jgi:predicted GNAT superfamily acetyltransferase